MPRHERNPKLMYFLAGEWPGEAFMGLQSRSVEPPSKVYPSL